MSGDQNKTIATKSDWTAQDLWARGYQIEDSGPKTAELGVNRYHVSKWFAAFSGLSFPGASTRDLAIQNALAVLADPGASQRVLGLEKLYRRR